MSPVATVTFHLAGIQQAWSARQRGYDRPTDTRPTKSGVLGLVANALGRDRTDSITDLASLRFAVRTDRPGHLEVDYHATGTGHFPLLPGERLNDPVLARAAAKGNLPDRAYVAPKHVRRDKHGNLVADRDGLRGTIITRDHYLADAAFTIALTGEAALIDQISDALTRPARTLFLGRRAYPLCAPLDPRRHTTDDPVAGLDAHPGPDRASADGGQVWADTTADDPAGRIVVDQPTSYAHRTYQARKEHQVRRGGTDPMGFFSPQGDQQP